MEHNPVKTEYLIEQEQWITNLMFNKSKLQGVISEKVLSL